VFTKQQALWQFIKRVINNNHHKHLRTTIIKTLLAGLATAVIGSGLFSQQAQADPIVGNITFGGSVNLNSPSAAAATAVTEWHGFGGVGRPRVVDADGDFLPFVTPGVSQVTFAPGAWFFNTTSPIVNFWSVGGFGFELTASSIFAQGAGGVIVNGYGWITGNGFDRTYGTWAFTTQDPGAGRPARFSFSAANSAVPDSGSTVALLAIAFVGVEALRRRTVKVMEPARSRHGF
jgi:hypothetical protein